MHFSLLQKSHRIKEKEKPNTILVVTYIKVFFLCLRQLSMSRDGWMKKKANASDDNGWAERVSAAFLS